ncbi:MAG TPA: hypothetical protein PKE69_18425 [Pyrinomonadaceae bacterium]|nr:hypothetical protein [Pyrinomonadaceae bacterium]
MSEENSTGNNLIWAITTLLIVTIIAGAFYFLVLEGRNAKKDIDVEIKVPTTTR